jgi:hypothetical protein
VEASNEPSKARLPVRILAVVVTLLLAATCGAFIAGASDNTTLPTCHDVNRGQAKAASNGDCFDGSTKRADAGLALAIGSGLAMAAALVLSIMFAVTGRRGRLVLILIGVAIVLALLEILVIHI